MIRWPPGIRHPSTRRTGEEPWANVSTVRRPPASGTGPTPRISPGAGPQRKSLSTSVRCSWKRASCSCSGRTPRFRFERPENDSSNRTTVEKGPGSLQDASSRRLHPSPHEWLRVAPGAGQAASWPIRAPGFRGVEGQPPDPRSPGARVVGRGHVRFSSGPPRTRRRNSITPVDAMSRGARSRGSGTVDPGGCPSADADPESRWTGTTTMRIPNTDKLIIENTNSMPG
jgi:hypothetical protein